MSETGQERSSQSSMRSTRLFVDAPFQHWAPHERATIDKWQQTSKRRCDAPKVNHFILATLFLS